jgi:PAS domain S-box-containing protein
MKNISEEQMFKEYKEAVDEISFVSKTDTNGNITYVNDLFCKLSGYSRKELIGNPHSIVKHPDIKNNFYKEIWKNLKNLVKKHIKELNEVVEIKNQFNF